MSSLEIMKEGCIDKKDAHGAKLFTETAFFFLYGIGAVEREGIRTAGGLWEVEFLRKCKYYNLWLQLQGLYDRKYTNKMEI